MTQDVRIRFAKRLRSLRMRYGWTQEELAERADLAYRHVQRLESLKNPPPAKIDTLDKLARAFRFSLAKLLEPEYLTHHLTEERRDAAYVVADAGPPMKRWKQGRPLRKQRGLSRQRSKNLPT